MNESTLGHFSQEFPPSSLDALCSPRSVAVIGASRHQGSIGWVILRNLIQYRMRGKVFPVNPHVEAVHSIKAYPSGFGEVRGFKRQRNYGEVEGQAAACPGRALPPNYGSQARCRVPPTPQAGEYMKLGTQSAYNPTSSRTKTVVLPGKAGRSLWLCGLLLVLGSIPTLSGLGRGEESYDLLIRGGRVVDGTGSPARVFDIAITAGKIRRVGLNLPGSAHKVLDAKNLVVTPGFIDVHTHADNVAERGQAENFIRMGVTSIVAGNCGGSTLEVGKAYREILAKGVALNFATLVGHNSVRREILGTERRAPTADEMRRMKALVDRAMRQGALGFSTGLEYVPGAYAELPEIVSLAKVASARGGLYASHMRNEGTEIEKSIAETIAVGEQARCPVQISHIKIDSPSRWGIAGRILEAISAARLRGIRVRADQYAYTAGSSGLGIRFPPWVLEGGQAKIKERLDDAATWGKIQTEMLAILKARGFEDYSFAVVASYRPDPSRNGLSIRQIAEKQMGSGALKAQLEVMREMLNAGGAQMVYHLMSEEDLAVFLRYPEVMIASDSGLLPAGQGVPHPRGYGNNARVLGRYVRERSILSLEEAIRRMTSLPAAQFGFRDRGCLKPGCAADMVILDPDTVADAATFSEPHQFARGIRHVLVNGIAVVEAGQSTASRPGQILKMKR